jgi:hypothetical protein
MCHLCDDAPFELCCRASGAVGGGMKRSATIANSVTKPKRVRVPTKNQQILNDATRNATKAKEYRWGEEYAAIPKPTGDKLVGNRPLSAYTPPGSIESIHAPWCSPTTSTRGSASSPFLMARVTQHLSRERVPKELLDWHGHLCYRIERMDPCFWNFSRAAPKPDTASSAHPQVVRYASRLELCYAIKWPWKSS